MESFIDEIRDVIAKYKAIASARITALKSAIQVAWANFIKKPAPKAAPKAKKKAKKSG
jgi:LPS O-antigen subunit length determinant protein (WzzB/FepE family)